MTGILITVAKILIMVVILCAMIFILLGIGQLLSHDDDNYSDSDVSTLKNEVKKNENVISEKSVFNNFLVKNSGGKRRQELKSEKVMNRREQK